MRHWKDGKREKLKEQINQEAIKIFEKEVKSMHLGKSNGREN